MIDLKRSARESLNLTMERDFLLVMVGGAVGLISSLLTGLVSFILEGAREKRRWELEERLRREQAAREDLELARGLRLKSDADSIEVRTGPTVIKPGTFFGTDVPSTAGRLVRELDKPPTERNEGTIDELVGLLRALGVREAEAEPEPGEVVGAGLLVGIGRLVAGVDQRVPQLMGTMRPIIATTGPAPGTAGSWSRRTAPGSRR